MWTLHIPMDYDVVLQCSLEDVKSNQGNQHLPFLIITLCFVSLSSSFLVLKIFHGTFFFQTVIILLCYGISEYILLFPSSSFPFLTVTFSNYYSIPSISRSTFFFISTYETEHTEDFLSLANCPPVLLILPQKDSISFFLQLNNTPLCTYSTYSCPLVH